MWGRIGAEGHCAAEPLQVMFQIFSMFYSNIPALMAIGSSFPVYTTLVQSTRFLAFFCKILLLKTIAVLRTDGRVKWGIEDVAGLVAHRFDLVWLLLLFSDQFLSKHTWVLRNSSGSVRYFLNSGLVVISGVINRGALQTTPRKLGFPKRKKVMFILHYKQF